MMAKSKLLYVIAVTVLLVAAALLLARFGGVLRRLAVVYWRGD
jgi:hypothetical protein